MSKAIAGAAMLGGAILDGAAMFALASTGIGAAALPVLGELMEALVAGGVAMEAGALASALTSNRGMNITTRQAAACRQVIYGQQRVGGILIYESTTGSEHDQYNYVIVLAGHECESIQNLYLDGRQVHWHGSGAGYSVRNGVGFGGIADSNSYEGPNGVQYNFGGTGHSGIYCEARYGDQLPGDVMASLTANDPNWAADGLGNSPWVGGCTYIYLKIEANPSLFPNAPEIRVTVNGKNNIYDPRTGTTGFSQNWALICADVLMDTVFGLGDNTVNQAQLIAAANVCDEQVALGVAPGTLTEARYTTNFHYDTSMSPGDALAAMMPGAAGRISRIGGEWYLWPAYWQGPSFTFDENALTSTVQWNPYRSVRDLINRVNGTYIAPTYPYNIAGNLYDRNGFYDGFTQNNFPFAYQPTSFPQYAADVLHGYASDQWLNEDGGIQHPRDLQLGTVLSVAQAQRVAKIVLLRNRQQGSGTFEMGLAAFQMQPMDVMQFTFAANGWVAKQLEITGVSFRVSSDGESGVPDIRLSIAVAETDSSVYEWSTSEELTVYDVPASPTQIPLTPAPPTSMTLTSGAGTAVTSADGTVTPRIEVQWDTPEDAHTTLIQVQYQAVGASVWLSAPSVDVDLNLTFIAGVIAGQAYNVRIRSERPNGVTSVWEEIDNYTVSLTLSVTGIQSVTSGNLIGVALSGTAADIIVQPFTATVGSASVACLTAGDYVITGLTQLQVYDVYYIDASFAGGAITPIATQNPADYLGRLGYFLIGSVGTPGASPGGDYSPTAYSDQGSRTTLNPQFAYDNDTATFATVSSTTPVTSGAAGNLGDCIFSVFPNTALPYATTLNVSAAITTFNGADCSIVANIAGNYVTLIATSSSAALVTYTATIPALTNLSQVSVEVKSEGYTGSSGSSPETVTVKVYEIYIPYAASGQLGSDITSINTSANSNQLGTVPAATVITGAQLGGTVPGEMLVNGNFAAGITGWSVYYGTAAFDTTIANVYSGIQSFKTADCGLQQTVNLIAGHTYLAQIWLKTNGSVVGSGSYGAGIYFLSSISILSMSPPTAIAAPFSTYPGVLLPATGATGWTLLSMSFTPTATGAYAFTVAPDYGTAGALATVWFDNASLTDITTTTGSLGGVPAASITPIATLMPVETGADKTLNHVLTSVSTQTMGIAIQDGYIYTVAEFIVTANDPSDVFNIQATVPWNSNGMGNPGAGVFSWCDGYVDAPVFVGTSPYYGVTAPSPGTYGKFGFGTPTFATTFDSNISFFGSVTGLSAGTHTLALVFNNHNTGKPVLRYVYAICQQISS